MADDLLARLVHWFDEAEEASLSARQFAERDRDYYDGKQWTATEEEALKARGQAPIVVNRIKPKVDYLLGMERQARTDPKCLPRNPQDEQAAQAATQALRYVLDVNNFSQARSEVFENLMIEGAGFAEVVVEGGNGGEPDIRIRPIPWDRAFVDPHARRRDMSDALYRGQVIWMDFADAQAKWPDKVDALESSKGSAESISAYQDKPSRWWDTKRRRVRIVECWYREGGSVHQAVFCRGGILSGPTESPYVDEDGIPEDPYVSVGAFTDRDGNRYGAVRQLIGIQDEINKRRSKALHLLSVRQVLTEKGAVDDLAKARSELAKPDGAVEINPGFRFDLAPTGDMAQAQFELLAEAKREIDAVGPNAALSGKSESDMSGRAIQARQQGGQTEVGVLLDILRFWQYGVCRKVWRRVRQHWTGAKWVRVTDDPETMRFVQINGPETVRDRLMAEYGQVPPQMEGDPRLGMVVGKRNDVAALDVDIIIDEAPDTATLQQEQFQMLVDLARSGMQIPPDALIAASSIPNKERVLEAVRGNPQMQQAKEAEAKQARDIEIQGRMAELALKAAQAKKATVEADMAEAAAVRMTQPIPAQIPGGMMPPGMGPNLPPGF